MTDIDYRRERSLSPTPQRSALTACCIARPTFLLDVCLLSDIITSMVNGPPPVHPPASPRGLREGRMQATVGDCEWHR